MKSILNVSKILLKPILLSLVILFSSIFSLTNYAQASLSPDSDDIKNEDSQGVVLLNKNQVKQIFRPLGIFAYTEEQAEKLYNDGIFSKEDVERERQLRNSLEEEEKNNCNSDLESNGSGVYFIIYPIQRAKNVE